MKLYYSYYLSLQIFNIDKKYEIQQSPCFMCNTLLYRYFTVWPWKMFPPEILSCLSERQKRLSKVILHS